MSGIASSNPHLDDAAHVPQTFGRPDGPLVAICGLAGGSGTSTLAVLLARTVIAESRAPLLLAELDAASGGLAELTGVTSQRTLGQMAIGRDADDDAAVDLPFATTDAGLRVIASTPRLAAPATDDQLAAALAEARRAHALTVVDCGTVQTPGSLGALAAASHVVWTVPAGSRAAARVTQVLLDDGPAPAATQAHELLAVVAIRPTGRRGPARSLRDAAAERCERLVYVPFDEALAEGRLGQAPDRVANSLTAIVGFLATPQR